MPHLKSLVERHQDDAFALVGINTGDSPKDFRAGVKKYGVSWISAYQGLAMSPIADLYKVKGYPTYIVLDTDGKIAYRGHRKEGIDPVVKELLAKAKN